MAMTVTGPALAGPYESAAADVSGKEGYACKVSGSAGSEVVTLAVAADALKANDTTAVGVITSVAGSFSDGTQTATVQFSGVAYAVTGAILTAGAVLSPGAASTWVGTPTGDTANPKAIALQGGASGDLIQVHVIALSGATVA